MEYAYSNNTIVEICCPPQGVTAAFNAWWYIFFGVIPSNPDNDNYPPHLQLTTQSNFTVSALGGMAFLPAGYSIHRPRNTEYDLAEMELDWM